MLSIPVLLYGKGLRRVGLTNSNFAHFLGPAPLTLFTNILILIIQGVVKTKEARLGSSVPNSTLRHKVLVLVFEFYVKSMCQISDFYYTPF